MSGPRRLLGPATWSIPTLLCGVGAVLFAVTMAFVAVRLPAGEAAGHPGRLVLGVVWALYLVFSFSGWGAIVSRLATGEAWPGWGLRAALGMALMVVAGGVLNLTWTTSDVTISLLLAVGAVAAAVHLWSRRPDLRDGVRGALDGVRGNPALVVGGALVLVLATAQIAGSVHGVIHDARVFMPFDIHDDIQAYLVFPKSLLENGSLGAEPFEARRMLSLGGQSFLQALVLTVLPLRCLHLIDAGVAMLIILGLLHGAAMRGRMDHRLALLVMVVALSFPHLNARANTSTVLTGSALLLAWFFVLHEGRLSGAGWLARGVVVGLLASTLVCVKSSFLPVVAAFYLLTLLFGLLDGEGKPRQLVAEACAFAGSSLVLLLPWMISLYQSSGTLFYPLIGQGFLGGGHRIGFSDIQGPFDPLPLDYARALIRLGFEVAPLVLLVLVSGDRRWRRPGMALGVAVLASVVLLVLVTDPSLDRSLSRYTFPPFVAGVLAVMVSAFSFKGGETSKRVRLSSVTAVVVGLWIVLGGLPTARTTYTQLAHNVEDALRGDDFIAPWSRQVYGEMLRGIPADATVLTRLRYPFLLDTKERRVMIMGIPGMASPPPGMPLRGGQALAEYLLSKDIRYLAYTYYPEKGGESLLNLTPEMITRRYPRSRVRWAMLRNHEDFHATVKELMTTRKRLFDSNDNVLLDLASRVVTVVPGEPRAGLEGFDELGWTDGTGTIRNVTIPEPRGSNLLRVRTHGWHPLRSDPDALDPRAFLDGAPMTLVDADASGFLFEFQGSGRPTGSIRIESQTIEPGQIGARDSGRSLGIDIRALELFAPAERTPPEIETVQQPVGPTIRPQQVILARNFYLDNNWTTGEGVISGISYRVRETDRHLVVSCTPSHPFLKDLERIGLRVFVNGIELYFKGAKDRDFYFTLYQGLAEVNEIRLLSSTFVPSEMGFGADSRALGVPVDAVSFRGEE
jgi:hypothetical protein